MKTLVLALLLVALAASAQDDASHAEVQRQQIANLRAQANAQLNAQVQACQSKFAVTGCVAEVERRRIQVMSQFKHQEADLNGAQRRQRAAEQVQRTQAKIAQRALQDADRPDVSGGTLQERRQKQDDKVLQHSAMRSGVPASTGSRTPSPAKNLEVNRTAYADKVEAARQRRLARDERLKKQPAQKNRALPVPP